MLARIEKRGREFEQLSYDPSLYDYYKELNKRYEAWYQNYDESPKMEIDGDALNFVEDEEATKIVIQMVKDKLEEVRGEKF